jgi:ribosome assembly protein 4
VITIFFFHFFFSLLEVIMAAKIRQKKLDAIAAAAMPIGQKVVAQFKTAEGESTGPPLNLPGDATPEQLELLLNQLLNQVK